MLRVDSIEIGDVILAYFKDSTVQILITEISDDELGKRFFTSTNRYDDSLWVNNYHEENFDNNLNGSFMCIKKPITGLELF